MNISVTSWLIKIKFLLENYWGWGLAALGLWPNWIRALVSITTDSSHIGLYWGKSCDQSSSFIFDGFFILVGNEDHKISDGFEIRQYQLATIHKSMGEFECWSDPITDYGVNRP